jgi:hypothetical protein
LPLDKQINADKIVRYLNIKANIKIGTGIDLNAIESYYNQFANSDQDSKMIDAGYFESTIAIMDKFNM